MPPGQRRSGVATLGPPRLAAPATGRPLGRSSCVIRRGKSIASTDHVGLKRPLRADQASHYGLLTVIDGLCDRCATTTTLGTNVCRQPLRSLRDRGDAANVAFSPTAGATDRRRGRRSGRRRATPAGADVAVGQNPAGVSLD